MDSVVTREDSRGIGFALPVPCPGYVAAVMALHYAIGSLFSLAAAGLVFSLVVEGFRGAVTGKLVAVAVIGALALGAAGLAMLYSGQCVRRRARRRFSILCGALLFFCWPLIPVAVLTILALSRRRAIEYYESTAGAPAFPVVPTIGR